VSVRDEILVFLGPTLPLGEAKARLAARYLPPAAMGDVLALLSRQRPRALALVDGHFEHTAAVWHKELLYALERGVAVYGAASMGALRAAELHPFGMVGVGVIYRAYRRGALSADDEVAVSHGPAELGYPRFSEALVNLRHGLGRAAAAGAITERTRARLVALARARFFRERSWPELLVDGRTAGVPAAQLTRLAAFVARATPDLKADDARRLLGRLARGPITPPAHPVTVQRTWFFERAREEARARRRGR
jgi:hypothetical protein